MASGADAKSPTKAKRSNALPPPPPIAIANALGVPSITVEWLAGDGSDRCYYRLRAPGAKKPMVLMQLSGVDAQALKDNGYDWVTIGQLLRQHGLFVPEVLATMPDHAALVIEDYGDTMLEGLVYEHAERGDEETVKALYRQATGLVSGMLKIPPNPNQSWCKRSFDADRFVWELNFFVQKYLSPAAKIELSPADRRAFDADAARLSAELAANSQYFVHRDFHSRNIMAQNGHLAVIDFQDARLGPAAYDMVSLFFDSYVPFSADLRASMMRDSIVHLRQAGLAQAAADTERLWKPVLLQRQLKAIGSFGFLTLDKQRGDYLKYVGPALKTMMEQDLTDKRWPFLSGELLTRMRAALPHDS